MNFIFLSYLIIWSVVESGCEHDDRSDEQPDQVFEILIDRAGPYMIERCEFDPIIVAIDYKKILSLEDTKTTSEACLTKSSSNCDSTSLHYENEKLYFLSHFMRPLNLSINLNFEHSASQCDDQIVSLSFERGDFWKCGAIGKYKKKKDVLSFKIKNATIEQVLRCQNEIQENIEKSLDLSSIWPDNVTQIACIRSDNVSKSGYRLALGSKYPAFYGRFEDLCKISSWPSDFRSISCGSKQIMLDTKNFACERIEQKEDFCEFEVKLKTCPVSDVSVVSVVSDSSVRQQYVTSDFAIISLVLFVSVYMKCLAW